MKQQQFFLTFSSEIKKFLYQYINFFLSQRRLAFMTYNFHTNRHIFELVRDIKQRIGIAMSIPEGVQVYLCANATESMQGDVAEAGVFKGGTAAIIAHALPKTKKIHLFDTFSGLPSLGKEDREFKKGEYLGTFEEVKKNLRKYKNMIFHRGMFPQTASSLKKKTFSFVHLDLDLYQGTKDGLEFFYPKMNKGGVILIHDYPQVGILRALSEFCKNIPEKPIVLAGAQCMLIKV